MKKLIAMLAVAFTAIIIGSTSAEAKIMKLYYGKTLCQVERKGADMSCGKNGVVAEFDTNTMTIVKSYDRWMYVGYKLSSEDFEGKFRKKLEAAEKAAEEAKISPADKKRMKNFKNLKITIKRSKVGTKPQVTVIDKKTGKKVTEGVYYSDRLEDYKTVAVDNDKYLGEREVKWVTYDDLKNDEEVESMVEDDSKIFPYTGTVVYPMGGFYDKDVEVCFEKKSGKKWKKVSKAVKPGTYRCYFKGVGGVYTEGSKSKKKVFEIQTWKQIDKMKKYNFKSKPGTKKFEKEFLKRWNIVKTIAPFSDNWCMSVIEGCYPTYKFTKADRLLLPAWDCGTYTSWVCEYIYGKSYAESLQHITKSKKKIKVGMCIADANHVVLVLKVNKDGTLWTAEGNLSGQVRICDSKAKAKDFEAYTKDFMTDMGWYEIE